MASTCSSNYEYSSCHAVLQLQTHCRSWLLPRVHAYVLEDLDTYDN